MKVTLYFSRDGKKETLNTQATTFGQLVTEVAETFNKDISTFNCVVKSTNTTLKLNDAVLPTEDFVLFVIPSKVDSALSVEDAEEVDELLSESRKLIKRARQIVSGEVQEINELQTEAEQIERELGNG